MSKDHINNKGKYCFKNQNQDGIILKYSLLRVALLYATPEEKPVRYKHVR